MTRWRVSLHWWFVKGVDSWLQPFITSKLKYKRKKSFRHWSVDGTFLCRCLARRNCRQPDGPALLQGEGSSDCRHHEHGGKLHLQRDRLRGPHQRRAWDRSSQHQGQCPTAHLLSFITSRKKKIHDKLTIYIGSHKWRMTHYWLSCHLSHYFWFQRKLKACFHTVVLPSSITLIGRKCFFDSCWQKMKSNNALFPLIFLVLQNDLVRNRHRWTDVSALKV